MKYHDKEFIDKLDKYEIFVFGANNSGFHGAGSAGYAFKGNAANNWRQDEDCFVAIKSVKENGDKELRKGKWAIWGKARGLMEGREGKSYAIVTTEKAGNQGNVTLQSIKSELLKLVDIASRHPKYKFLMSPFGLSRAFGGYSWFTLPQMQKIFKEIDKEVGFPDNVLLHPKFK